MGYEEAEFNYKDIKSIGSEDIDYLKKKATESKEEDIDYVFTMTQIIKLKKCLYVLKKDLIFNHTSILLITASLTT